MQLITGSSPACRYHRGMPTGKVQVNVYLDRKIVRKLDEVRKEDGFSRSAMIGRLVRRYLRKLEKRRNQKGDGPAE